VDVAVWPAHVLLPFHMKVKNEVPATDGQNDPSLDDLAIGWQDATIAAHRFRCSSIGMCCSETRGVP
jgi:hypothetical protein